MMSKGFQLETIIKSNYKATQAQEQQDDAEEEKAEDPEDK